MSKILVPIDLSSVSKPLVDFAFSFASQNNIDKLDFLHVIRVTPGSHFIETPIKPDLEIDKLRNRVDKFIEEARETSCCPDMNYEVMIASGIPYEKIIEATDNELYDYIVIGHRGLSNVGRFFIGSVALKVVAHSPCKVVIFK